LALWGSEKLGAGFFETLMVKRSIFDRKKFLADQAIYQVRRNLAKFIMADNKEKSVDNHIRCR